ncbi:Fic family protein [Rhodoferax sp.]|uniref:Fic/DOC family protein n=1 Tax=Rhodoferax sp. TaxID=50421 RepID=UPI0025D4202E|nr:Fic family protein [Rhodoferax sp.]MCM2297121.1 Fic family protein [Rhodoferax sp.]
MSKYQFQQSDIYQPGTDLPINRLNIGDAEILQEVEAQLLQQAYQTFVFELRADTRFDEAYFQSLHLRTFESLYAWAGQYRTQDMVKGGSMFCRATFLPNESHRIFAELEKEDFLRGAAAWPLDRFAGRLAYFQSELIALHPFYELNGRITRLFCDLIAMANGYGPIDYAKALQTDPEVDNSYIRASINCVQRADYGLLQTLIAAGLTPNEAAA